MSLSSERTVDIYGLVDPRNDELRYVGWAYCAQKRLKGHLEDTRSTKKKPTHKVCWLRTLSDQPNLIIFETLPESDWSEAERFWIAYFKSLGCRLTNATDGGEGMIGFKHSDEARIKMSKGMKGKEAWNRGVPLTKEWKYNLSQSLKGRVSPRKGVKLSVETIKKTQIGRKKYYEIHPGPMKGKKFTPEQLARLSESHKGQRAWNKGLKGTPGNRGRKET